MQLKAEEEPGIGASMGKRKCIVAYSNSQKSLLTADNLSAPGIFAQDTSIEIHPAREGTWEQG